MGADYAESYGHGKTASEAFDQATEEAAWEYGHGGYTGTLAEKYNFTMIGTLPARFSPTEFEVLADNYREWKESGKWTDRVKTGETGDWGQAIYRRVTRKVDPRPKSLRTFEFGRMLDRWTEVAQGDKWGPAAAVRLNTQDERKYKADDYRRLKGTQAKVFYFAGYCSS